MPKARTASKNAKTALRGRKPSPISRKQPSRPVASRKRQSAVTVRYIDPVTGQRFEAIMRPLAGGWQLDLRRKPWLKTARKGRADRPMVGATRPEAEKRAKEILAAEVELLKAQGHGTQSAIGPVPWDVLCSNWFNRESARAESLRGDKGDRWLEGVLDDATTIMQRARRYFRALESVHPGKRFAELEPADFVDADDEVRRLYAAENDGNVMSNDLLRRHIAAAKRVAKEGVLARLGRQNPMRDHALPRRMKGGRRAHRALSAPMSAALWAFCQQEETYGGRNPWRRAMVALALFSGMRPDELLGLEQRDLDLVTWTVRVRANRTRPALKPSKHVVREIPLARAVRPLLAQHFARLRAYELLRDDWPLFPTRHSTTREVRRLKSVRSIWHWVLEEMGWLIPVAQAHSARIRDRVIVDGIAEWYCMRHTFATVLLSIPGVSLGRASQIIGDNEATVAGTYVGTIEGGRNMPNSLEELDYALIP